MFALNANVTNNSNVNFVTLFTMAVEAGKTYCFEGDLFFKSAATTTGLVLAVDVPASPVDLICGLETGESVTGWRTLTTTTSGAALVGTAALTTPLIAHFQGTVTTGASGGNIVVKFRSEVNGSLVTVLRGSTGRIVTL